MKTMGQKDGSNLKVGDIVDAMHLSGAFEPLMRDDIYAVVEIFLKEYVGMPGTIVTKKFTPEAVIEIAERTGISREHIVSIVTVFRLKAAPQKSSKLSFIKSYLKPKVTGGGKGFNRRM